MSTVYITREVPNPMDMYNPWKDLEIEVEVEITQSGPYPEGVVISSSHSLAEIETQTAVEVAIDRSEE